MNILLGVFFFFLSIITLLDYQDVFSFANPCFQKKTKTMRYIGRSCSYGESVLILQRKNKAFSFIFPCLMMKPKSRRELLMNWVLVNWKRKMVSINWLNFYTPVWKTDVLCRGNVSRLSLRPSDRRPFEFSRLSNVIFKMAVWWPYWIFRFLDSVGGMVSGV